MSNIGQILLEIETMLLAGKSVNEICKKLKIDKAFVEGIRDRIEKEIWASMG